MVPVTSAMLAALSALLGVLLTVQVIMHRVRLNITTGYGGNAELAKVIRAHANFAEQVPLALLLFTLAEMAGAPRMALIVLGALLLVARILSAWGLSSSAGLSFGRQSRAGMTLLYMVGTAGLILYTVFIR